MYSDSHENMGTLEDTRTNSRQNQETTDLDEGRELSYFPSLRCHYIVVSIVMSFDLMD